MGACDWHPRARLVVEGARRLVGAPFRPQGRGRAGYDCLGVVLAAADHAGILIEAPADYELRFHDLDEVESKLDNAGWIAGPRRNARPGDVLLGCPAHGHIHFAVCTEIGIVEAHAGLRRVVERPLAAGEPWKSAWRLPEARSV